MDWRFVLFGVLRHPTEARILLLRSDRAFRLPRVRAPNAWGSNARVIVPAYERRLGTTLWLLRQLRFEEDEEAKRSEIVLELALLEPRWRPPRHGRWVGRAELGRMRLRDEAHRALLDGYLEALERDDVPAARAPWARPGWHNEVRDWVEAETALLGHRVLAIEQVKQWSISSVLRIVTDGPDLYFKASARLPLFVNEATITQHLSERFPDYVPAPLAVEPTRGWMLLPSLSGLIEWDAPLAVRRELFSRFAALQLRAAPMFEQLLAAGCLDRRLEVLDSQLDPLLEDLEAVTRLTADEVAELRQRAPVLRECVHRLGEFHLPPTLVHGDLHPGNVARAGGELVYFDWTDACVAHPFFDLHSLQWVRDESVRSTLLDAYLEPWEEVENPARLRQAAALATVVTPLHHAVSYRNIVAGLEPSAQPELDAAHEFLREALARVRDL